jgi:hypothetical protein
MCFSETTKKTRTVCGCVIILWRESLSVRRSIGRAVAILTICLACVVVPTGGMLLVRVRRLGL